MFYKRTLGRRHTFQQQHHELHDRQQGANSRPTARLSEQQHELHGRRRDFLNNNTNFTANGATARLSQQQHEPHGRRRDGASLSTTTRRPTAGTRKTNFKTDDRARTSPRHDIRASSTTTTTRTSRKIRLDGFTADGWADTTDGTVSVFRDYPPEHT